MEMLKDSSRKPKKKDMEHRHGIPGIKAKGVKIKVVVKVKVREKVKEERKVERKVEKEKENGINGISSHMGETPIHQLGETPMLKTGESCKANAKNGCYMVTVAAAFNVPWTTILTAKVLEKERSQKAKAKAKRKEKEEANRASQEVSQVVKKANHGPSKDLGLQPGGRLPLVQRQMVQQIDLHVNSI